MSEPEEYERTWVVRQPAASSPPAAAAEASVGCNALPLGTHIGEFELINLVGIGGFGIVYLAHDLSLGRYVALKEYMPSSLAERVEGLTVAVKSARLAETFAIGLRSFVNEARMLAQFDHRSLVKVYRFWEANGTAYMVMPFYEGITLRQALQKMPEPPSEQWLRGLIDPLLDALEVIHQENCFHRDIAPDNILLLADGRPLLLDFGAARRVIGDRTQALTVILKPGYAPLEQYAEDPHVKQGAWTDLYALAAVVYNAITRRPPMASVARSINDTMVPLTQAAAGRYSKTFLQAMDRALAVRPEDRPQSVAEFRALLAGSDVPDTLQVTVPQVTAQQAAAATVSQAPVEKKRSKAMLLVGVGGTLAAVAAGGAYYALRSPPTPVSPPVTVAPSPAATPPAATPAAGATASPLAAEIQTADRKSLNEQQLVDLLLGKNGATNSSTKAVKPFDPADILQEIYRHRDPEHVVAVVPEKARVKIGQDKLRFRVSSHKPGYVYILMLGTNGRFNLLFPNAIDADNGIAGEGDLSLPRPGWAMTPEGPPGSNRFLVIVSDNRRDFSATGLRKVNPFAEFPLDIADRIAHEANFATTNPFAGKVICPASRACSSSYGAALFVIDEIS
ncbi:MAG: serine/threonine-protein kinase [Accumulibacter sp.]|jgi:serine/threonine protein kinase|uniref:serine/threonine-protein kinase n=1 Tax=Accumulibacter sp. TaxID=2053492 RepID=UPI002FC28779